MELLYTGERLITNVYNRTMVEHLHRYCFAREYVENKTVLDIACGEGYGANILSDTAQFVYGVDIADEAIQHARSKYTRNNLQFLKGYAHDIPLENESIDVIVSFETIEHHDMHHEMIRECKRVLKKNGVLIISSPDKKHYSEIPGYKNAFHVKELYREEFYTLIASWFNKTFLLKQGVTNGSLMYSMDCEKKINLYCGDYEKLQKTEDIELPVYNLIIASDSELACPGNSFFESKYVNHALINEAEWYKGLYLQLYNSRYNKLKRMLYRPYKSLRKFLKK